MIGFIGSVAGDQPVVGKSLNIRSLSNDRSHLVSILGGVERQIIGLSLIGNLVGIQSQIEILIRIRISTGKKFDSQLMFSLRGWIVGKHTRFQEIGSGKRGDAGH